MKTFQEMKNGIIDGAEEIENRISKSAKTSQTAIQVNVGSATIAVALCWGAERLARSIEASVGHHAAIRNRGHNS